MLSLYVICIVYVYGTINNFRMTVIPVKNDMSEMYELTYDLNFFVVEKLSIRTKNFAILLCFNQVQTSQLPVSTFQFM